MQHKVPSGQVAVSSYPRPRQLRILIHRRLGANSLTSDLWPYLYIALTYHFDWVLNNFGRQTYSLNWFSFQRATEPRFEETKR